MPSERDRDFFAGFYTAAPKYVCVKSPWPALITGRLVNTAVRDPALDAISIRAAVVCVPLLLCAGRRQHTSCAVRSLLLKTGNNTPYPCPASEARATVRPTWPRKLMWPLCSCSLLGGYSLLSFAVVCWLPIDRSLLVFVRNTPFKLF